METVKNVDITRYVGTWYEIARFPHSFEKGLVGVTATYTLRENGRITVLNQGYKHNLSGNLKQTRGVAKIPDPNSPGRLKVKFFLFFGADYYILELDQEGYRHAMVGSSSPNYLWILCREPVMDDETYRMLVDRAAARGYETSRLVRVPQKGPGSENAQ
jgi:apolipoprotein D and lipocalin family protein